METYRFMVKEDELETRSKDREEEDQYTHRQRIRENTERGEQRNRDYRNNKKGLYEANCKSCEADSPQETDGKINSN